METGRNDTLDLDLVRHSSEARVAFVKPVSIEDRPLLWMVVRSQTYYPEHILAYESGKARYALVIGSGFFPDRLIGGEKRWRSKHHTETRSQVWGLRVQVWTRT